jgi:3-hydroxyisobutyrate dehydrogenase-like beta-hydroxyacid dehydrogenase
VKSIGVIGLGNMGRPIARNILKGGFEVAVYDLNQAAVQSLVEQGARAASRPADVAMGADLVLTILPDGPDVEQTVLGENGVFTSAREGMVLADLSTVNPAVSRRLADEGRKRNLKVLDAAMARSVEQAERGELVLMVGGTQEDLDACRPVFDQIATDIHFCGPNGTGATMKLINNLLGGVAMAASCEALLLGVKAGLAPETMLAVLGTTGGNNATLESLVRPKVLARNFEPPSFALNLQYKDARLALDLAAEVGATLPIGALVQQLRSVARARGRGGWDTAAIATVFEELDGAELRGSGG